MPWWARARSALVSVLYATSRTRSERNVHLALSPVPLVLLPGLAAGQPARFAVFDVPDRAALVREGASTCVATVVGGRLVHRRR